MWGKKPRRTREITWDWRQPKDLDEELEIEVMFDKVFDNLKHLSNGDDINMTIEAPEEAAAIMTALLEISMQLTEVLSKQLHIPPVTLLETMRISRPRGPEDAG